MENYPKFISKKVNNNIIDKFRNSNNFKIYKILFIILCFLLISFIILYFIK